jgi:outer membrane protein
MLELRSSTVMSVGLSAGAALLLTVAAVIPGVVPSAAAADVKIGVIDSQRIFSEYQVARDAEAVFQEEMRGWLQEVGELERELVSLQERIRGQALLLSKEKLDEMQAELDGKRRTYEARKSELFDQETGRAVARNQELSAPINEQITTVVERLGSEGDYTLILDMATVNVVFLGSGVDLTDRVLEELANGNQ